MKNLISNIPGLRIWLRWFKSIGLKIKNKRLKLGYNSSLNHVTLESDVSIGRNCNLLRVDVGRFSYLAGDCFFRDVKIGRFCAIAPNVKMGLGFHPIDLVSVHPAFYSTELQTTRNFASKNEIEDHKPGTIGNDVWIGANVVILDGVNIANGAVIAAGAVVNKDVLPYEIVGGVPAKHIKFRFSKEKIDYLEEIKWWNWEIEKIRTHKDLFLKPDDFIATHKLNK